MKKLAYQLCTIGTYGETTIGLYVDINREFTDKDELAFMNCINSLKNQILEETINLDPKTKGRAIEERNHILSLFDDNSIFVEEIPNGYCSEYCCKHLPWFIVTTKIGRIKIGWRKRVIHIDWSDTIISGDGETLFPEESKKTTVGDKYIHAWSYEKAKEYIDILLC